MSDLALVADLVFSLQDKVKIIEILELKEARKSK